MSAEKTGKSEMITRREVLTLKGLNTRND